MSLPYNRWRRVLTVPASGDSLLVPIENRGGSNVIVGIDASSRVASIVTSEGTPEHKAFVFDTATGTRYIHSSTGTLHAVTDIGPATLEWDSTLLRDCAGRVRNRTQWRAGNVG